MEKTNEGKKMRGAIAAFVKTPGLSPIKTRLAKSIGKNAAEEFFLQSVEKTQNAIHDASNILQKQLTGYWAVGEKAGLNSPCWRTLQTIHTGDGGLDDRMSHIYSSLLKTYGYVILIGSDSPDISSKHIIKAVKIIENGEFVFGPTYDGGFYLFGGQKPIETEIWKSVEYSRSDTMANLSNELSKINDIKYLEKLTDIDTEEDFKLLKSPI